MQTDTKMSGNRETERVRHRETEIQKRVAESQKRDRNREVERLGVG
jgi:hypothetical protein